MPQPGWDSAYDWQGFIPFEELPISYNPPEGYIVTANNAIVAESYPYFLTRDWDYGWRAARIVDLLERKAAMGKLTADDMRDIQADNEFSMGKSLASAYMDVSTGRQGPDAALDMLRAWDAQNSADSAAAAFANVLWDELVLDLFVTGREHPAPVTGQGRLFLVVDGLLDDPDSRVVDQRRARRRRAVRDARARGERGVRPARRAAGRQPRPVELGIAARAPAARTTRSARRASRRSRCSSTAVRTRSAAAHRSSNATGWEIGEGFETITVPVDAHGRRPVGLRRVGVEPPHRHERPRVPPELRRPDRRRGSAPS